MLTIMGILSLIWLSIGCTYSIISTLCTMKLYNTLGYNSLYDFVVSTFIELTCWPVLLLMRFS